MNRRKSTLTAAVVALILAGCEQAEPPTLYDSGSVMRRDIVVAVEAAGVIEPSLTVEVKSKASGEILRIDGETGDRVEQGTLLVHIDQRSPRNQLAQAEAELEAAIARRGIAAAQSERAKKLLASRTINEVDYEQTILEFANAKADVIRSEVAVENARIALDDADVRAPVTGTIIEKLVEQGQVISSPTMDVGGGTLLMKMANLSSVQVKALVDESDIGKIRPGQPVTVTVTAYPNQPFEGVVAKIEPQALAEQTVTTFSVLILLDNESRLLRPGMNADVEIRIAERRDVIAVPTAALRTGRDINVSSELVGLSPADVSAMLRQDGGRGPRVNAAEPGRREGGYRFESRYWVFVDQPSGPRAVNVVTGLTDLDYSEVISGLAENDRVLLLPSSGLILAQKRFQAQMSRFMSMPGMGGTDTDKDKDKDKRTPETGRRN
ncbi:MAG: efflux RND transporter periplasmic adaptor subunit [Gammaproteobacteria bacterium]